MTKLFTQNKFSIREDVPGFALYFDDVFIVASKDYYTLKAQISNYQWLDSMAMKLGERDQVFLFDGNSELVVAEILSVAEKGDALFIKDGEVKRFVKRGEVYPATARNKKIIRRLNYLSGKFLEYQGKALKEVEDLEPFTAENGKN